MASWAQHFASYRKDVTINGAFASDFAKAIATMEMEMKP